MKSLEQYFQSDFQQYYTGTNVSAFIDNIYLDELTMIGWRGVKGDTPLYPYNDQLFNAVAKGTYRVEGKFSINFTTTGYMEYIIAKAASHPANFSKTTQIGRFTYEHLDHKTPLGKERLIKDDAIINDKFIFDKFKAGISSSTEEEIRDASRNYLWGNKSQRIESLGKSIREMFDEQYFNILVMYGNPNSENYTLHNIINAKIIDVSQQVAADGTPIQEIYTFLAQDLDRPLFTDHPVRAALAAGYVEPPVISPIAMLGYIDDLAKKYVAQNIIAPMLDGSNNSKFLKVSIRPLVVTKKTS